MRHKAKMIAEQYLKDYKNLDRYINDRLDELKYPLNDDDNVGGGKSSHIQKPEEELFITIDEDKCIQGLKKERDAVGKALDGVSDAVMYVIKNYYWKKHNVYQLYELGTQVGLSKSVLYRQLNIVYNDILKERGLYELVEV